MSRGARNAAAVPAAQPSRARTSYGVTDAAAVADLHTVDAGLDAYNRAEPELAQVRALHVVARGAEGEVIGGAIGRTWGRNAELQQMWVHERERGRGVGAGLLQLFEHEAAARGCTLVYLTTFSFQAPAFYARLGYREVLAVTGYTGGITWHTMHKSLEAGAEPGCAAQCACALP